MMGRVNEASETIEAAQGINSQTDIIPYHLGDLFTAQALIDMARLGQAIAEKNRVKQSRSNRQAAKSIRLCLKNAKKAACYLTEALLMKGQYYWLTGNEQKALKWWDRSIKEGERLGARPDLARTYFEVGKRLLEPQSKTRELNGLNANDYLARAEKLFREMDLQWLFFRKIADTRYLFEVGILGPDRCLKSLGCCQNNAVGHWETMDKTEF